MMNNTAYASVLVKYMKAKFLANKDALGLKGVFIGNPVQLPQSPIVVLTAGRKTRDLAGVSAPGGRTKNYIPVYVDVMSSDVLSGEDKATLDLYDLADTVEAFIHQDVRMEGLLIHGFVQEWDPGTSFLQGGAWRTVRLTFIGLSETYLSA